ncbi:unnamed protein product, partial [Didymodactylos carnosus]
EKDVAKQMPYGNSKSRSTAHVYRRAVPSTVEKIKEAVKSKTPTTVYKSMVTSADSDMPRNLNQVHY